MRRSWLLIPVLAALALPTGTLARSARAPAQKSCSAAGYSRNAVACASVPTTGSFTVHIPKSKDTLKGTGGKNVSGTKLTVIHVPAPVSAKGGYGIRVRATGKLPALKLSSGKLWLFKPSSNSLKKKTAVTAPGVYQITH